MPNEPKKILKSKARVRASVRYAPPMRLSSNATLLLLLVCVALSFVAFNVWGDVGGKVQTLGQSVPARQYRPDIVATASLGETFTLDEFRYEVRGAVSRGSAMGFQKAQGMFIEVAIAVENSGSAIATPHAITLIDKDKTQFPELPQFSLDGTRYSEVLERGMEPGDTRTFFALFDVASSSKGLQLTFYARDGRAARDIQLGM